MTAPAHIGVTGRIVRAWVGFAVRHAPLVVVASVATTVPLAWYAVSHLGVNTSTADMISAELPWRQTFTDYRSAFPQLDHTLVVVIDAPDADHADAARDRLVAALRARDDLFASVFAPASDPFFRRHALLYLDEEQLYELSDTLARVQPLLARLAADPTAAGLFDSLALALNRGTDGADPGPLAERIAAVIEAQQAGVADSLSWQALMQGADPAPARRIVVLRPRLDFARLQPARAAIEAVRDQEPLIAAALPQPVRIRLTGPVALEYEELVSVTRGAQAAGLLALATVLVILTIGLRSGWLVGAALASLLIGLVATAAFAALAVGSLNLISIAFAVLYIGLGIDFAIHYCLRFREALARGAGKQQALTDSAADVGASLVLCALTTSIGFFAFFPTTFRGVSELGLISGTGMYISLLITLTVLPALLAVLPAPAAAHATSPVGAAAQRLARSRALLPVSALLTLAGLAALPFVRFDSDPINLRDAASESVATYRDLRADPDFAPRNLSVLVADAAAADAVAQRVADVAAVVRVSDFVPTSQPARLAIIEDLAWLVGPALQADSAAGPTDAARTRAAAARLREALAGRPAQQRLAAALDRLLDRDGATDAELAELDRRLVGTLPGRLAALDDALAAGPVTLNDLPAELRQRWIAADGRRRVELRPAGDSDDFVAAVRARVPEATGLPVVQREAGHAVVTAFRQAFVTAFVLIGAILLALLRSWRLALVVLVPLTAAGVATVATMVLVGQPFNFANVIALPLLLGVGVDSGIHMVHRWRGAGDALLASSTARAIWFSALTTLASFGNLAFSVHPGSASMGRVLTIGMIFTTLATLVLVPALLARLRP